jgi:hypothetical protein
VFFAVLFEESPVGIDASDAPVKGLDDTARALLQQAAWDTWQDREGSRDRARARSPR